MKLRKSLCSVLLAIFLMFTLAACGASESYIAATSDSASMNSVDSYADFGLSGLSKSASADEGAYYESAEMPETATKGETETPAVDSKLVYRADISLETLEFDFVAEKIEEAVSSVGGYLESKDIWAYGEGYRSASFTARVPAEKFTSFCNTVGELATVKRNSSSVENITEGYYDTVSRLDTAKIKLERLQNLLKDASTMEDIISLENAISSTEYEIDRLSGNLRHYDQLVGYSTVRIEVEEVYRVYGGGGAPLSFGERAKEAFREGLDNVRDGLENFTVWLLRSWLSILLIVIVVFVVVRLFGFVSKKTKAKAKKKMSVIDSSDSMHRSFDESFSENHSSDTKNN